MIHLHSNWLAHLSQEFSQPYMKSLKAFLVHEYAQGKRIFPSGAQYFAALDLTPFDRVRVVILGQDPYHGLGQAHGLCFSVPPGVAPPPSLQNIFKELGSDLGLPLPSSGCLEPWAHRGVLLLNSVLTVEEGRAASHQGRGWERFTDHIIHQLSTKREGLAFVLWGGYAQKKAVLVDRQRHFVLESPHPSPLSAHRGFMGSRPFSRINAFFLSRGEPPLDWSLTEGENYSKTRPN